MSTSGRSTYSRSLRKILDVTDSALKNHPLPDSLDNLESSLQHKLSLDNLFTNINLNEFEDQFERSARTPFLNKRETSYGSLMSILSENSTHTQSSCSFDEDSEASCEKLSIMLQRVDDILFNGIIPTNMNEKLAEDCLTWSKTFPHLRIAGNKTTIHPGYSESDKSSKSSQVEDLLDDSFTETIAEQYDNENGPITKPQSRIEDNIETMERIKEKVINKLVEHLLTTSLEWKNATSVDVSKPFRVRTATATRNRERLRPMTAQATLRTSLPPVVTSSLRPLEGILVVSSKVLQNRSYLSRPSSSVTRLKPTEHGSPKLHLLRSRLATLPDNLEDIEENNSVLDLRETTSLLRVSNPPLVEERLMIPEPLKFTVSKEYKSKERPLSLPPVHAGFKEQGNKNMKRSPTIQNAVLRRHKMNQNHLASRPPSAREASQVSNSELEPLSYQGSLPSLPEENNFLKILPIIRNSSAHHSRPRINSFNSENYRKIN